MLHQSSQLSIRFNLLVLLLATIGTSCSDPEPKLLPTSTIHPSMWININYWDCISEKCVCDCLDSTSTHFIIIDSVDGKWQALMCSASHTDTLSLVTLPGNFIVGSNSKGVKVADFSYNFSESIEVDYHRRKINFFKFDSLKAIQSKNNLNRVNAKIFLSSISATDTLVRSLLALDSTELYCDSAHNNIIYAPDLKIHNRWSVNIKGDSIESWQFLEREKKLISTHARH